jgi:hypothetical protein
VDKLIDSLAVAAKRIARRWLVPRPSSAPRRFSHM